MKLIDADALRDQGITPCEAYDHDDDLFIPLSALDEVPEIACAADNPHGLTPSKCPTCGEELVPSPCMDLAQDSYRDGILYGQAHPEWGANG